MCVCGPVCTSVLQCVSVCRPMCIASCLCSQCYPGEENKPSPLLIAAGLFVYNVPAFIYSLFLASLLRGKLMTG